MFVDEIFLKGTIPHLWHFTLTIVIHRLLTPRLQHVMPLAGHEERGGHTIPSIQLTLALHSSTREFVKKILYPNFGRLTLTITFQCLLT